MIVWSVSRQAWPVTGRESPDLLPAGGKPAPDSQCHQRQAGRGMNLSRLRAALDSRTERLACNQVLLDSVDSTNSMGLRVVRSFFDRESLPPRTIVVAMRQASGRGRLGRSWVSPSGQGAYLSLVAGMHGPDDVASLPLLVGVGLCQKISEISGAACRLKWPNDLMVEDRKIGGILIDCVSRGTVGTAAVIGIGVNYGRSQELSAVGGIAMDEVARELPDLPEVISELAEALEEQLDHIGDIAYAAARYRDLSAHRHGDTLQYRTEKGIRRGVFTGFDERGFLILRGARGEIHLGAGEAIEEWTGERHES